jgi:DNA polymerase III subunit epsilon
MIKPIYPLLNCSAHAVLETQSQAMPSESLAKAIGLDAPGAMALLVQILDGRFKLEAGSVGLWAWERPFPAPGESIVALDIEATNGDPLREEIIEIGAIKIWRDQSGSVQRQEFSRFNEPQRPISPYVQTLTGINAQMLKGAPPLEQSLRELLAFLGDATLVIQNAPFDLAFLRPLFAKLGCELDNTVVDTLDLARQALPGRRRRGLDALGQLYGVPIEDRHRALGDARATLHIAQALYFSLSAGRELTLAQLNETLPHQTELNETATTTPESARKSASTQQTPGIPDPEGSTGPNQETEPPKHPKRNRRSRKSRSLGPLEEVTA